MTSALQPESGKFMNEFTVPTTMTPDELGDHLAQLVWESFSDFMLKDDAEIGIEELGIETEDGIPPEQAVEEALVFLMWAHTRGAQLAFTGRTDARVLKTGLDSMHHAVFEDLVENGTPEKQLPLFEAKITTRYVEYNQASRESDDTLGEAVIGHLAKEGLTDPVLVRAMTERALAVATPLKDFLSDVELVAD